jgi:1-acyl-sn-glycerol-3-phosphate acyltransferase
LLCEKQLNEFSKQYPHLTGFDFVEQVLAYFSFTYRVNDQQRERIPETGKLIIIANHPIGTLDGLALIKCVKETRSDIKVVANNMLMAVQPLHEILLPVNNMQGGTQKQNIQNINLHLRNEGALIVFPAGEVSRLRPQGVRDAKWQSGFLKMAKVNQCPILPMYLDAKNSAFFYGVSMVYKPAASALLVKEMFKKKNKNMDITIGEVIPLEAFVQLPISLLEQVKLFKKHVYNIDKNKCGVFPTQKPIAMPEERRQLLKALKAECEILGEAIEGKTIYLYRYTTSSPIMRELGRLREIL